MTDSGACMNSLSSSPKGEWHKIFKKAYDAQARRIDTDERACEIAANRLTQTMNFQPPATPLHPTGPPIAKRDTPSRISD